MKQVVRTPLACFSKKRSTFNSRHARGVRTDPVAIAPGTDLITAKGASSVIKKAGKCNGTGPQLKIYLL